LKIGHKGESVTPSSQTSPSSRIQRLKGQKEEKENEDNEKDHVLRVDNTPEEIIGPVKQG
jgi:hypothetical protein